MLGDAVLFHQAALTIGTDGLTQLEAEYASKGTAWEHSTLVPRP